LASLSRRGGNHRSQHRGELFMRGYLLTFLAQASSAAGWPGELTDITNATELNKLITSQLDRTGPAPCAGGAVPMSGIARRTGAAGIRR